MNQRRCFCISLLVFIFYGLTINTGDGEYVDKSTSRRLQRIENEHGGLGVHGGRSINKLIHVLINKSGVEIRRNHTIEYDVSNDVNSTTRENIHPKLGTFSNQSISYNTNGMQKVEKTHKHIIALFKAKKKNRRHMRRKKTSNTYAHDKSDSSAKGMKSNLNASVMPSLRVYDDPRGNQKTAVDDTVPISEQFAGQDSHATDDYLDRHVKTAVEKMIKQEEKAEKQFVKDLKALMKDIHAMSPNISQSESNQGQFVRQLRDHDDLDGDGEFVIEGIPTFDNYEREIVSFMSRPNISVTGNMKRHATFTPSAYSLSVMRRPHKKRRVHHRHRKYRHYCKSRKRPTLYPEVPSTHVEKENLDASLMPSVRVYDDPRGNQKEEKKVGPADIPISEQLQLDTQAGDDYLDRHVEKHVKKMICFEKKAEELFVKDVKALMKDVHAMSPNISENESNQGQFVRQLRDHDNLDGDGEFVIEEIPTFDSYEREIVSFTRKRSISHGRGNNVHQAGINTINHSTNKLHPNTGSKISDMGAIMGSQLHIPLSSIVNGAKRSETTADNHARNPDTNTGFQMSNSDASTGNQVGNTDTNAGNQVSSLDTNAGNQLSNPYINAGNQVSYPDTNTGAQMSNPSINTGSQISNPDTNTGAQMSNPSINTGSEISNPDTNVANQGNHVSMQTEKEEQEEQQLLKDLKLLKQEKAAQGPKG